jgi:hypothetical protein
MAGWKKKLRYSSESPWFPKYYIGWMGIGNCSHETSNTYLSNSATKQNECILGFLSSIASSIGKQQV